MFIEKIYSHSKNNYSINIDWNYLQKLYKESCFCVSMDTNLSTYISVDGHEEKCFSNISEYLLNQGLIGKDYKEPNRKKGAKRKLNPVVLEDTSFTDESMDVSFGGGISS